jgi:melibiose permease/lactose/raffinose/galactose permease
MKNLNDRNKYFFGLGTIGRDMFYAFEANTIIYFLTHVLSLPEWVFLTVTMLLSGLRIFDAVNDTVTGMVIDNIRSRWGKFKPAILVGGIASVIFYLLLFGNIGTGWGFIIVFCAAYLLWDISYGINDIAYWTLLPALTTDQKQREKNGAFARICANVGMYIVMVAWQPVTQALGNTPDIWLTVAIVISVFYLGFLCFTVFGVKENRNYQDDEPKITLKDMARAILKNDQLMWTMLSMALFMVGYTATVGFAVDYMKYVFGDEGMYVVLVGVCGVAQLSTLAVYPFIAKHFTRKQLYTGATILVIAGYLIFFIAEISIVLIALGAVLVFVGQAAIQLLMLMFLSDTVEYGQWKLGKRSESVTFSIQPLVNKIGGAISTAIVSLTLVASGIKVGDTSAEFIGDSGKLLLKVAMFVVPLIFIVVGYIIYLKKFKIDEGFYAKIISDLKERGQLKEEV